MFIMFFDRTTRFYDAMNTFRRIVSAAWLLLGIGLAIDGIMDLARWIDDTKIPNPNWWSSTNIIPGVLSVVLGVCLMFFPKTAKYLGYAPSFIFGLYVIYIVAITPPGYRVSPMLVLQISVLALSAATAALLWKDRKSASE